ncbi:MAG: amino acid adenylation domain-containing protein [Alcaligenaceae bacterium]
MDENFEARLGSLSPAKRALLEKIKAAKVQASAAETQRNEAIPRRNDPTSPAPLSFAQQRLWFLAQLDGLDATYNMPSAIELLGPLDVTVLKKVFDEICDRHEALRTNFVTIDGQACQITRDSRQTDLAVVNLQDLTLSKQQEEYERLSLAACHAPFDLEHDHLLRLRLVKFNEQRYILLMVVHHIVSDGWSNGNVLLKEICMLYEAFSQGLASPLLPLPIQYADFAQWQRKLLDGPRSDILIRYWKTKLKGIPSLIELPTDYPRPLRQTYAGKTTYFTIDSSRLQSLKSLGKPIGASLFVVLQAVFCTLIARYSRQRTVVLGSPIANRTSKELEQLIGFFLNTLVLRTDVDPQAKFTQLLTQVRNNFLEAYEHQDLPFERLVEVADPERNPSFSPLFQVMLILQNQNEQREGLRIGDVRLKAVPIAAETAMFDLTLKFEEQSEQLFAELEYNTDLFKASTIQRFVEHFENLLDAIIQNPEQKVSNLILSGAGELKQITSDFNQTSKQYAQQETLCDLFERQAADYPDRIAVLFEGQQISFGELNVRASHLAAYLTSQGATTETLIGLCVERSPLLIIGLLGILKSGAAYVPIDPSYPTNRIKDMVDTAQLRLIVAQNSTKHLFALDPVDAVCLDSDWSLIKAAAATAFLVTRHRLPGDSLAYVIFTSGSTGKPKGVQITHNALHNFLQTMLEKPGLSRQSTLLAVTTISFDIAALELYLPLISGARIALVPKETAGDGHALVKLLFATQATALQATPATWRLIFASTEPEQLALEQALCGGEALSAELAERLLKSNAEVWNVYGPTETTIWSARNQLHRDNLNGHSNPSIGRPIANTSIFIIDPSLATTPLGIPGDLYIGGSGLSRGYLNEPGLTAERFIPSPFSQQPGQRIYQTGDVARFLENGDIEYIGRSDFQVKVRGFRIELGEIESVLAQHPLVKNAVAVCQVSDQDHVTLNAFIEIKNSQDLQQNQSQDLISALRTQIAAQLPSYMLPSNITILESLPLTPNGKIDRKALPTIKSLSSQTQYVGPRNDREELMATLWSGALNAERIHIHDNFFNLGGHSLLALQIITKVRDEFLVDIPVQALFDHPTIALLVEFLDSKHKTIKKLSPPILARSVEQRRVSVLSYSQKRLWFLDQLEGLNSNYHISTALELLGKVNVAALNAALLKIVERHEILRTIYSQTDGEPTAVVVETPLALLETTWLDTTSKQNLDVQTWLSAKNTKPFDLSKDIPIRADLLELNDNHWALALTLHHIASDEASMLVLQRELLTLYEICANAQTEGLAPLKVQYSDFATWQQRWLNPELLTTQLAYWKKTLDNSPTLLNLPIDKPRPAIQGYQGRALVFFIDQTLTQQLKSLCSANDVTPFMGLFAGYAALLAKHCDTQDLVIGTPVTNRNRSELNELIGLFVNTLPIRILLEPQSSSVELLSSIRKTMLEGLANQDTPFESIVDAIHPERSLSHAPIFQTMFVLQNAIEESIEHSELKMLPLEAETSSTKFDLTLAIQVESNRLRCVFEYNVDLFEESTIEQLAAHYTQLLGRMAEKPYASVLQTPLLSVAQRHQFLNEFNPQLVAQRYTCAQTLFEQAAALRPDAIALTHNDNVLTFEALNRQANKLAWQLRKLSLGPDSIVALIFEPSPEMVISMLGILKAGAAYLPILPATPFERQEVMLTEARVQHLLCSASHDGEPHEGVTTLHIEDLLRADAPTGNPTWVNLEESLAYVIYTSGSTGKPKGVGVSRSNLAAYLKSRGDFYTEPVSGLLLLQPYAFDISSGNIFWTLCQGGCLHLAPKDLAADPTALLQRIAQTQSSHLVLLPLLYSPVLALSSNTHFSALRHIILGGDSLLPKLAQDHYQRYPGIALTNEYGPTETTIMCTAYTVPQQLQLDHIPIGKPVSQSNIRLFDQFLDLGLRHLGGELTIGGPQVSRGYLNQAALTAEKFVPDPFCTQPGQRLYRSGDFARYLPEGHLLFQGRKDKQVKIRGFRIELAEIENALLSLPMIQEACVTIIGQAKAPRLYSYLVLKQRGSITAAGVIQSLKNLLPEYMLPAGISFLDALPATTNGKLDFDALPAPVFQEESTEFVAARDATEKLLCQIWQDVLDIERVGIHDNFFDLGGDSILSIQIVSRLKQSGITLSVKQLFQQQTVAQLAAIASSTPQIVAPQETLTGFYPLGPIQHWFFENFSSSLQHFNQSVYLHLGKQVDTVTLEQTLQRLVEHHDVLRSKFITASKERGEHEARIENESTFKIVALHDLSKSAAEHIDAEISAIARTAQASLSLQTGDLLRAVLLNMPEGQANRLLLIVHHLVIDGISWRILLEDLESLLVQHTQNIALQLKPKTSSFAQWTTSLSQYANSQRALRDLPYWQTQVNQRVQKLPVDISANLSKNTLDSTLHLESSLDAETTQALLTEVPKVYRTQINDILITALVNALGRWTQLQEFEISLEGHGREDLFDDLDMTRTVGWFTSLFPVRLSYRKGEDLGQTIGRIKERMRSIPANGLTYGLLRYLNAKEQVRHSLTQATASPISFNYLGQFDQGAQGQVLLAEAKGDTGSDLGSVGQRQALIDINSRISSGQFFLNISYSNNIYAAKTIEDFSELYLNELRTIVRHCAERQATPYIGDRYPLATLTDKNYTDLTSTHADNIEDIYPLSPMQEGMAFHSRLVSESGAYIIQLSCEMSGRFEPNTFVKAWESVLARHPSLRVFIFEGGQTSDHQVVLRQVTLQWETLDWTQQSFNQQQEQWQELVTHDRHLDYSLETAPLMRFYLVKLSATHWKFLWSHHHILTDGWCLPILMKEVLHHYHNPEVTTLPRPTPYRDYIAWLKQQDLEVAKTYWLNYLADFSAPTFLGIEKSLQEHKPSSRSQFAEVNLLLSEELSGALAELAKRHRLTLSNILQTAWATLLHIYSQSNDIAFGATVSGRPPELDGVEGMVGLFINTLPVRATLKPNQTIVQFMTTLLHSQMDSDLYAYTPLVTIQACSELPPRTPLFNSILVFENYPLDDSIDEQAQALSFSALQLHEQTNLPLTLTASGGQRVPIKISYDQNIFASEKVSQLLECLHQLLDFAGSNPQLSVSNWLASVTSEHDQRRLQTAMKASECPLPDLALTLPELFERQVQQTPDKIAITLGQISLSYAALNRKANQFARQLQSLGAKPGDLIGVCLERSPSLMIALLGIQKLAAVYVPIDPEYPRDRVAYMVSDSRASVLIVSPHDLRHTTALSETCQLLPLDLDVLSSFSSLNLPNLQSPLNPTYVIYTSGSTGNPKGVEITQADLVNFLLSVKDKPGLEQTDSLLAVTTISFDIAGLELYLPLITGATIMLLEREQASDGASLLSVLQNSGATVMQATPITWRLLLEAGWDGTGLKKILCGGEAFPVDLANQLINTSAEVWNLYGPTETTIWSTRFALSSSCAYDVSIPIGEPLNNTTLVLQDKYGNLLPHGIAGELFIGGKGLANGYLNRPALTAEKFVPDGYGTQPGARLYATGDLAKYDENENLVCLGRLDQQVKLRGFRIELGEIEAVIQKHESVKQAVVQVIEISTSDTRLAAFVTFEQPAETAVQTLENWLQTQLPGYMVPTEWVVLDAFPLTPNGKLDKKALPKPNRQQQLNYQPATTQTEQLLEQMMAEVLNLEQVSREADFFNLGGHSLLATRLVTRIKQHYAINFPASTLFEKPTIAQLGQHIDNLLWSTQQHDLQQAPLNDDEEEFKL